jgi:TolB protein
VSRPRSLGGASEPGRLLAFSSGGATCLIRGDGSGLRVLAFDVPGQVTWQACGMLPDGRALLLSMAARRDGPGRPFDVYYHQTPTRIWAYDMGPDQLEELATVARMAPFYAPMLALPDGRILMQVIRDRPGQVFNMRLDGSDARPFTGPDEGLPYGFSLHPAGARIAFHLASAKGYQIWTCDVLGKDRVLIASEPGHLYFGPSWSPDGQWLIYQDCHAPSDPGHDWSDLRLSRADGTAHRLLTDDQAMWFAASYGCPGNHGGGSNLPHWTPCGQVIFPRRLPNARTPWQWADQPDTDHFNREFRPEQARGGTQICRLDPASGSCTVLTAPGPSVWDFRAVAALDGTRIAFCRADTGGVPALWMMAADGGDQRLLTRGLADAGVDHPRWLQPDAQPGRRSTR